MRTHGLRCAAALALALSLPAAGQPAKPEIQRMEEMLQAAPDHGGLWLAMAAAQARAGNRAEALRWLEKAVSRGLDFDLPEDDAFSPLRETPEMKALLARAAANRRVVSRGRVAFRIPEKDLIPEAAGEERAGLGIMRDPFRNPLFDIPTTGVLAGGTLAVIANSQLDRLDEQGRLKPGADLAEPVILEIPID